jgi:hypothetical protein
VISEARLDDARRPYIELANVGTDTINLSEFEFGKIEPWSTPWGAAANYYFMLPDKKLAPGKTFLIAMVYDWGPEMFLLAPEDYDPFLTKREWWTLADIKLHYPESSTNAASDSVTPTYHALETWGGREAMYLKHYPVPDDSVLVDQVNGVWYGTDGTRGNYNPVDVAGFANATRDATLVRKFSVKQGNIDFESGRGQDLSESEWMPIPHQAGGTWADNVRRLFWTAGNHGDYNLDAESFVPAQDDIQVDWDASTITVPWGVRRDDSIMFRFVKAPGLAWHYDYVDNYLDSAKTSAQTGDTLTVYACGNDLDVKKFAIIVSDPTASANLAVPKKAPNNNGFFAGVNDPVYTVTDGVAGMDTIGTARFGGIPFATRIDTLEKYIEIPENATWEVEWVGGAERIDLQNGDIFKVIAEDNTVKEYYVKVDRIRKSHLAFLSSITWPDIPEELRNVYGFIGDTIPNFVATKYNYVVTLPVVVKDVPALVPHTQDLNAKVAVKRATSLEASVADRTVIFTSTAEDDTTIRTYTVQLDKEIEDDNKEVYNGTPFISEFVWQDQWASGFMEVVNPGNTQLDMSNYMFSWGYVNDPASAITRLAATADWANRYGKYIPGYKWQDEAAWGIQSAIAVEDPATNALVLPGDVFVIGDVRSTGSVPAADQVIIDGVTHWWATLQCDIELATGRNPWAEDVPNWNALQQWNGANWYLFRIENDSITAGLKPATDPADFTLVDVFGSGDGTAFLVGGLTSCPQTATYIRKPSITQGNTAFKGSFGTTPENSEWILKDRPYYDARGIGWPYDILNITEDLGSHYMLPNTDYRSTVSSPYLIVSPGFGEGQTIDGVVTDTTAAGLAGLLVKVNEGESFTFIRGTDTLDVIDTLATGDVLVVTSKNLANSTSYTITVGEGLSNDAHLTSTVLDVLDDAGTGTVSGFENGTTVRYVMENVTKDAGAKITVHNGAGAYVPLKVLNYDTLYVDVLVNNDMYFEVVSESGMDTIVYKLVADGTASDAFVTSSVYAVSTGLIDLVPYTTSASGFLANLVPSAGATMVLKDRLGFVRTTGDIASDDILEVTSEDESITNSYFIQMLGTTVTSFAYVVSEVYLVDQIEFTINGGQELNNQTTVAAFLANLTGAEGATVTVTNSTGAPKTSGFLAVGDLLVVTSSDGQKEVTYDIDVFVSNKNTLDNDVIVYPNPSRGQFNISGLKAGNRIHVTNIVGATILDQKATAEKAVISLDNERNGFYFITVSDGNNVIARHKVVKE